MKLLQTYFATNILKAFALSMFALVPFGLLSRIIHYSPLFMNAGTDITDVLSILFLIQPKVITVLLPFCLSIGCFVVYNNIISTNEHIAIYSTGKGNELMLTPFFFISIFITLFSLILSNFVVPNTYVRMSEIHKKVAAKISTALLKPNHFIEQKGVVVFINKINPTKIAEGIIIIDDRKKEKSTIIVADKGIIGLNNAGITLDSEKTTIIKYTEYGPFPFFIDFESYYVAIGIKNKVKDEITQLSYRETTFLIEQLFQKNFAVLSELKTRIGWPCFVILIPLSIIACLLRFFSFRRSKVKTIHIVYSIVIFSYVCISGIANFIISKDPVLELFLYYLNICLIFCFLLFMCKRKFSA